MSNTWFRMYSDVIDDERLRSLESTDRWHFIAILCCKAQGIIDGPQPHLIFRKVALKLGISVDELLVIAERLSIIGLINKETLSPSMEFIAENSSDLRPNPGDWIRIRAEIFQRDNYTCQYCGERGEILECDHVIPVSRGGSNETDNLVTACRKCNRSKRDKLVGEWRVH